MQGKGGCEVGNLRVQAVETVPSPPCFGILLILKTLHDPNITVIP